MAAQEVVDCLTTRISQNNRKYKLNMKGITENTEAFSPIIKLILAKGVRNYLVLVGENTPDLDEKLGYCGADVMLYAQAIG